MASVQSMQPDTQAARMSLGPSPEQAPGTDNSAQKRKLVDMRASGTPGEPDHDAMDFSNPQGPQSVESLEISESKRRAQNRAAQRAFRERKERYLRELESRLAELESESRSWKSTNMALRSQLSLLEEELQHYRRPQAPPQQQNTANGPSIPGSIQGGVPGGASIPGGGTLPAHMMQPYQDSRPVPGMGQPSGQPSPESMSIPGLSFESPGSNTASLPSRADEFCDQLSTACGTRDRPVPETAPRIASETPAWQQESLGADFGAALGAPLGVPATSSAPPQGLNQESAPSGPASGPAAGSAGQLDASNSTADWVNNYAWSNTFLDPSSQSGTASTSPGLPTPDSSRVSEKGADPLNLDFGNLAPGFGRFRMNSSDNMFADMNGLLNNDFGVFDPLDDMLVWDPPKQSAQSAPVQNPQATQTTQQPDVLSRSSQGPFADAPAIKQEPEADEVPAASHKFIPCADVWDRICSHPRFGEIDINSMCQELRNKARCSKSGVVLDEQDVVAVLGSIQARR